MYVSSYLSLNTALSGVEAAQEELETTSNNIANESTTDYQRETVTLKQSAALQIAGGGGSQGMQMGTGVNATGIANASNQYLDTAYRNQNAVSSSANTTQSYTAQLQDLLGENNDNDGAISSELSNLWSQWTELSDSPSNEGAQEAVVAAGQEVTTSINQLSQGITSLSSQASAQYDNLTQDSTGGQVYDDVNQIASLNASIQQATAGGTADNQLINERNAAVDDLSSLANVTVTNNSDGTVNIGFGGVSNLVSGTTVNWPATSSTGTTMGTSGFTFPSGATASSIGGTLGALIGFAGTGGTLDTEASQLDTFAETLATSVNDLTASSTSGVTSFFTITTGGSPGSAAASIAVNPSLVSDPTKTPTTASSGSGSNDIAVAVSELSGGAPDTSYESLVESIGGITQAASNNATNQSTMLTQIENQKESAEGVDNNQEMSDLIEEQQAYEASAKVMSTFSTMMDSLMQAVGG